MNKKIPITKKPVEPKEQMKCQIGISPFAKEKINEWRKDKKILMLIFEIPTTVSEKAFVDGMCRFIEKLKKGN